MNGGQSAGDPGKKAGDTKGQKTNHVGAVADEFSAFRIVANGITDPAQWGLRKRIHECGTDQAPCVDQVVDLDLRPEAPAKHLQDRGSTGRNPTLAAKETTQDQSAGGDEFADAK